jgi:hypothetical protein
MGEACVQEDRSDEAPHLVPLLDFASIFPAQFVEGFGIRSEEFSVDNAVEQQRNTEEDDVHEHDEDCEGAAPQSRTHVLLQRIPEGLIPRPFLSVHSLGLGFFPHVEESSQQSFTFFIAAIGICSPLLFLLLSFLFLFLLGLSAPAFSFLTKSLQVVVHETPN